MIVELYVENLAAAEGLVKQGQFNAAKVLRALAHTQRAESMNRARHEPFDLRDLLDRNLATLSDPAARDIAARARASLDNHVDVAESDVDQHIWGCYGCGRLVEGQQPDSCPGCGALAVEFEWFGPFYAANPEHLGQQSPQDILDALRRTPDEVAAVLAGRPDLGVRPAPDEWSLAEIVGHLIETDAVFRSRVTTILDSDGVPVLTSARPWTLHEGKGYETKSGRELISAFGSTRAQTVAMVEGLSDADWGRKGTLRGGANSLLDLGSWLANHDTGHLAQTHRQPARRPK